MEIFGRVLHTSVTGGVGILAFYLFWKLFGKKCFAKTRKAGWILIALYFALPFSLPKFQNAHTLAIPEVALRGHFGVGTRDVLLTEKAESGVDMPILEKSRSEIKVGDAALFCWAFGVVFLSTYNLVGYWVTYRKSLHWSVECKDEIILKQMAELAGEIPLRKLPSLRMMADNVNGHPAKKPSLDGPFTIGLAKKIIYLPEGIVESRKLEYILKHEMTHCRENDNFWKLFFLAVHVVHWFNPLVWLMRKSADWDMELVCDENVTKNASRAERKEYGNVLLDCLEGHTGEKRKNAFSADYAAEMRFIKRRFDHIFDCSAKQSRRWLVGILVVVLFLADGLTKVETKENMRGSNVPMEEFWDVVEEKENIWRFATGLEIMFPKEWNGKIVTETDAWPSPVPTSDILVVCEKTNAEAGWGGDLFYLSFRLYQGWDMVIMEGTLLGVYEQNGKEYILELSMPASLSYAEGDEERKAAYEELSTQVGAVRINTDGMQGFTQCGIDDLEWVHDDSWLELH